MGTPPQKKKIAITVAGPASSGKTSVVAIIARALRNYGVHIEHVLDSTPLAVDLRSVDLFEKHDSKRLMALTQTFATIGTIETYEPPIMIKMEDIVEAVKLTKMAEEWKQSVGAGFVKTDYPLKAWVNDDFPKNFVEVGYSVLCGPCCRKRREDGVTGAWRELEFGEAQEFFRGGYLQCDDCGVAVNADR